MQLHDSHITLTCEPSLADSKTCVMKIMTPTWAGQTVTLAQVDQMINSSRVGMRNDLMIVGIVVVLFVWLSIKIVGTKH